MRARSRSPKRGGRSQRQAARISAAGGPAPADRQSKFHMDSEFAFHQLKDWSWGKVSASDVQKNCMYQLHDQEAVLKSVGVSPDHCLSSLRFLSGLGSSGRHPSNIRQQLVTLLGEPSCPHPFVSRVELTVLKPRGGEETSPTEFPVLLPHELFSHIFEHFPQRFDDIFCNGGGVANLRDFWDGAVALRDPRLKFHSAAHAPRWRERCVPLSLHGDAVATTKIGQSGTRSFDVFSWAGLLATGSTKVVKLYTWGVFEPCKTEAGMSRIWAIVTWSLRALADGIWPETDVDGVPFRKGTREHRLAGSRLAGDYFAIPWILKADWEHWHKCWWLKYHSRNDFCEYCDANRGPNASMLFNNVRSDAAWKETIVGPEAWRERNPKSPPIAGIAEHVHTQHRMRRASLLIFGRQKMVGKMVGKPSSSNTTAPFSSGDASLSGIGPGDSSDGSGSMSSKIGPNSRHCIEVIRRLNPPDLAYRRALPV